MEKRKLGWSDLFISGSVVDVDFGYWSARTKIKEADLDIDDSPEVHKALALGSHRLAPKDAFQKIHEIMFAAKRRIDNLSFNFPFIRGARYVPDVKISEAMENLRRFRDDYNEEADRFVARYGAIKAEMLPVIRKALVDATGNEEVAKAAYDRVLAMYPPPDEVRAKFYMKWNIYSVSGAKSEAAGEALAEENESVKSIVRSMVEQIREEFAERVGAVLAAVAKGGKLNAKTIESTRDVMARVESMNLFGDRILADQVSKLRSVVDSAEADGKILTTKKSGYLNDLTAIQGNIERSIEEAVAEAETNLTGMGRRKFSIPKAEVS